MLAVQLKIIVKIEYQSYNPENKEDIWKDFSNPIIS